LAFGLGRGNSAGICGRMFANFVLGQLLSSNKLAAQAWRVEDARAGAMLLATLICSSSVNALSQNPSLDKNSRGQRVRQTNQLNKGLSAVHVEEMAVPKALAKQGGLWGFSSSRVSK